MIRDIAAVDDKGGMARAGKTPWQIPEELAYFYAQTKRFGGNLLVGRGSYEAMQAGLKSRSDNSAWPPEGCQLYVLTSRNIQVPPKVTVIHSVTDFLAAMEKAGKDVWNGSIADVDPDEIYLTRVTGDFGCDKFYPMSRLIKYRLVSRTLGPPRPEQPDYAFEVYARLQSTLPESV